MTGDSEAFAGDPVEVARHSERSRANALAMTSESAATAGKGSEMTRDPEAVAAERAEVA